MVNSLICCSCIASQQCHGRTHGFAPTGLIGGAVGLCHGQDILPLRFLTMARQILITAFITHRSPLLKEERTHPKNRVRSFVSYSLKNAHNTLNCVLGRKNRGGEPMIFLSSGGGLGKIALNLRRSRAGDSRKSAHPPDYSRGYTVPRSRSADRRRPWTVLHLWDRRRDIPAPHCKF